MKRIVTQISLFFLVHVIKHYNILSCPLTNIIFLNERFKFFFFNFCANKNQHITHISILGCSIENKLKLTNQSSAELL